MTIDEDLLDKARALDARSVEADQAALLARADYHTAVRRLHLAGGSLREISQALGVSHQRVQQIVDGAGGSWWQRAWRTRNAARDAVCTGCERPPSEVAKLLAGPDMYLCDGCVALAEAALRGAPVTMGDPPIPPRAAGGPHLAAPGSRAKCGFCRKPRAQGRPVVVARRFSACGDCLRICREILDGRSAAG
jgi:hypothetical protein